MLSWSNFPGPTWVVRPRAMSTSEGTVSLFSRAAQRLFGYSADLVVGHMNARELYPPGGARLIKRLILSPRG